MVRTYAIVDGERPPRLHVVNPASGLTYRHQPAIVLPFRLDEVEQCETCDVLHRHAVADSVGTVGQATSRGPGLTSAQQPPIASVMSE